MLLGTVVDENEAVVPEASVSVKDISKTIRKETKTSHLGVFIITELPPGNYTVAVKQQGFATAEIKGLALKVNDQVALRIQLKVGQIGETVTVDPDNSIVQRSAAVATTLNRQMVGNLPLNGRSLQPVISLTPGVAVTKPTFAEQGQFSVNGQRANANYFMVDGVSANIGVAAGAQGLGQSGSGSLPGLTALGTMHSLFSIDALQAFKILTSTFAPEFGRTPGAQVLIQTRTGSNQFRGSLFEYFRSGALSANDWFANRDDLRKPQLSHHDFGGVLGGPIIKGKLFPFLFVTIACGAISGFHSLVSSGTTPKMLNKECDARFIGYGAMVAESLVAVLSLIAACSLFPGDYFGINVPAEAFAKLGLHTVNLDLFSSEVGEKLAGRTGGAVSLAVGMAQIFRGIPGMTRLMGYWYHYAIMFEALFILTTIDTGTRVARYVLQELLGKVHKPFANHAWQPGNMITTFFVVLAWGYLIYTGNISTLWPLFGTGNQLLATIALAVGTAFLINMGKAKYAWITVAPMLFVGTTTLTAGVLSIKNIFWPLTKKPGFVFQGYLDSTLMAIFVTGVVLVLLNVARRCWLTLHGEPIPKEAFGPQVAGEGLPSSGCC